jgi:integrase/recombinase XerD
VTEPTDARSEALATEVLPLLTAMMAHGWTRKTLAGRLGVSTDSLRARGFIVDEDLAERIRQLADELLAPGSPPGPGSRRYRGGQPPEVDPRFTVEVFVANGMAKRTAYLYSRAVTRASVFLAEELGADLATCTGRDLVVLLPHFPSNYAGRQMLRSALKAAFEVLGREDPPSLKAVRIPPKPKARSRALDHEDAVRLERAAWERGDEKGLAVLVGLYSALRRNEIAKLAWEQIIDDTSERPQWLRIIGKGDLDATVPLHPNLAELLAQWRKPWSAGPVFRGRFGGPVSAATIWAWTKEVAADIGLTITTHQLRHTALTEANDATLDLRAVQEIARHSKPETTAIYTRVTGQRLLDVVAAIDYGRRPEGGAPDPADQLPGISYRQLLVALEESEERAAAWVALGLVLHQTGRWEFKVLPGPCWQWIRTDQPDITATAAVCRGVAEFTLFRQYDDDTADTWDFDRPELVAALADALVSGVPAPPSVRLGPWVEKPFVQLLRGEEPNWSGMRGPLVGVN